MARILMLVYGLLMAVLMWPAGLLLRRHPNFAGTIRARLGLDVPSPPAGKPVVWLHAASVGEVKAVSGLIQAMKEANPDLSICLSSMTATGRQVASGTPGVDLVFPLPFDAAWVMRRYLAKLAPRALVIVETELWPGMISQAGSLGVPVVIVNARMTERSFRRYSLASGLAREILSRVRVLAMAEADASRFSRLGAGSVKILGNLKLDAISGVDPAKGRELREILGLKDRFVFIAGSVREGEEQGVMDAVRAASAKVPGLFSILAPRHPQQIGTFAELARQDGINWCLKSRMELGTDMLIVDTMGELFGLYGVADVAFVGGSLVDMGGQNILEPVVWGVPTVHGPHMDNFTWALEAVENSTTLVHSPAALGDVIADVSTRADRYRALALQASSLLEKRKGVTRRYVAELADLLR